MAWACDRTSVVQQWPSATGEAKNPITAQSTKAGCLSSCNAALKVWMMPEESSGYLGGPRKWILTAAKGRCTHKQEATTDMRHCFSLITL